jgi:hypothetical protein
MVAVIGLQVGKPAFAKVSAGKAALLTLAAGFYCFYFGGKNKRSSPNLSVGVRVRTLKC